MIQVKKRDGKIVDFNINKIKKVIESANKQVQNEENILSDKTIDKILKDIEKECKGYEESTIDACKLQELIEKILVEHSCNEVLQIYHDCCKEREKERFKKLEITNLIHQKLSGSNIENQNANVDEKSFGGRIGETDSALLKEMALDYYISPKIAKKHKNNEIYIHDLDRYVVGMHNCLSIPMDKLLKKGFTTRQVDIRPANSINTAFQLIAVIIQLQSLCQFGGVSSTHIDSTMIPYVRKSFYKHFVDGMKYIEDDTNENKGLWNKLKNIL